ncbi:formylmethanofuran dehydrogenase subunit C [Methylovorus sp. MM2]|uniref:formylmethanofuran dehydrogenase subunit C n=1 Tax=Methylovorus sp. MM2 TaxID=1848038 RepID=UPI0007DE8887|nr:formylmethanofuran dehydrogenase subunit C [Methylovorus sp. MM2]OAM52875.1 formylmethanofuran dehydrogenase subunit C [Methylovorus sp. MM2]
MSALTFTLKSPAQQRIDLSPLTPDKLAGKSIADIGAILLQSGKTKLRTDEVFAISGDDSNGIVFDNANHKLDYIGSGMKSGKITINGGAGSYLGFQMKKGEIILNGDADAFAASGMADGFIHIKGNVGDFLGAAYFGERKGMKGGTVLVTGNAGERAGDQMRRGLILIEGNVGAYCASRMLAGTIGILGNTGEYLGYGMRRGTLLVTKTPDLHATIQDCGTHTLPFLNLMFKSFAALPSKFSKINQNRVQRYAGDLANDGKGEILVLQ